MKLWEYEHPYYCNEGNFYSNGCFFQIDTWDEFMSEMGSSCEDLNLLWRWDWGSDEETGRPYSYISLFYMIQRKGYNCSFEVKVNKSDHEKIKSFLRKKSEKIKEIWEPFI